MPPGNVGGLSHDTAKLGIDHLVVTQVDATVGDVTRAGSKKDQVAGLGVLGAHVRVGIVLLLGRPGKRLTNCLAVDVLCEAGAVE